MEDRTLVCKDCGKEFVFTVGEQEFYKEKGFDNDPVRCPDCRRARKQQRKKIKIKSNIQKLKINHKIKNNK